MAHVGLGLVLAFPIFLSKDVNGGKLTQPTAYTSKTQRSE